MPPSVETVLVPFLDPGERLLWSGQPRPGIRLRALDIFLIPFTLLWCGFAIFWESMVILKGAPIFFMLWGVPFVCVGLFIAFGRFFVDARARARTWYGVTSQRILIVNGLFSRQIKSLQLRTLTDVSLTERGDRSGTILFGPNIAMNYLLAANPLPIGGRYGPPSFDLIERAKDVYDIIGKAQRAMPNSI